MLHVCFFFFFNDTATTEIYTLSLHDALPISRRGGEPHDPGQKPRGAHVGAGEPDLHEDEPEAQIVGGDPDVRRGRDEDRKSTRLNSSHTVISYAVFCLKKKNNEDKHRAQYSR